MAGTKTKKCAVDRLDDALALVGIDEALFDMEEGNRLTVILESMEPWQVEMLIDRLTTAVGGA